MEAPPSLVRLTIGGLLLDPQAFRAQRNNPAGLQRGLVLVLLIALLVAIATFIGDLGEYFTQPDPQLVSDTLYRGITAMPWYERAVELNPELATLTEQAFAEGSFSFTPTPLTGLLGLVLGPIFAVIGWFISGAVIHIAARAFGGVGSFSQTLATVALSSAAGLLGLVQVIPYAESLPFALLIASSILSYLAAYVAVRETHGLAPWRSFWAVLIGPLLLTVLLFGLYCCFVFALAGLGQGGA